MNKIYLLVLPAVFILMLPVSTLAQSSSPVLLFSDLTWGPKTGWEGSATKGAAVTIWGKNFGSTRGTSYVTVNGAQVTDYAEWDAIGPARGLERITFWVPSTATSGAGTISVTVNGVTSNTLPFNVAAGTIYFISVSDGSNSYNGLYSTRTGHTGSDGPFKDLWKFNPCGSTDPYNTPGSCNPSGDGQYIVYVRGGTYTTMNPSGDPGDAFIAIRGPYGGPTKQKALIGYPTETPIIDTTNAGHGITWVADYSPYGHFDYYTISKLYNVGGTAPYGTFGSHIRFAGNHIKDNLDSTWSGLIMLMGSQDVYIYGNYFEHNGYDSYKHNIYIKSAPRIPATDQGSQYVYVGWNEIADPVAGTDNRGGAIFISKSSDSLYEVTNIYIHDNYFHGGNMEFIYTGDNTDLYDIYIYNNIFTGGSQGSGAIFLAWDTRSVYVYNNVFSNTHPGRPLVAVTGVTAAVLRNNIFNALSGQETLSIYGAAYYGATINSGYDLFYGASVPSGDGLTVANARTGDPLFINAGNSDFHLQSGSPAIDTGTTIASVTRDYDNTPRPQGSGYDIGAYEYASGYVPPVDTTPPVRSGGSPSGTLQAGTTSTTISLTTDEPATCRYSTSAGVAYSSMANSFSGAGTTSHSTQVSGLQNGTAYNYYVRCSDSSGNYNTDDYHISFSVSSPPVCGNSVCEIGETCSSCPADCSCSSGICCSGTCQTPACSQASDCGSDTCRTYTCSNAGTCSASCSSIPKTACQSGDSCCPSGCTNYTDSDCTSNPPGLVLAFSFNEGSGTTASDASGNGNTGTLINGPTWAAGRYGNALSFDGVNDYVNIANDVSNYLNMMHGTISFWYKGNGANVNDYLFSYYSNSGDYLTVYFVTTTILRLGYRADYGTDYSLDTNIPDVTTDTNWHFVSAMWNVGGSNWTLSLTRDNGTVTNTANIATPASYSGTANINDGSFPGLIDEVRIYNRALSQAEIQADMNTPVGQSCHRSDSDCSGCVSMAELNAFISRWQVSNQDVTLKELMEAIGLWKRGC